jgi:hypothetical protein
MRTGRLFWGIVILLLGTLLLLQTLGLLAWSAWAYFWPFFLILLGVWFLLGPRIYGGKRETVNLNIPVEGAQEGVVEFNHGAGRLRVGGGASPADLLDGTFVGGVAHAVDRQAGRARVKLSADAGFMVGFPWSAGPEGFRWDVNLSETVPLELVFHTGAGESVLNLRDLLINTLRLETGASSTEITLPARAGFTKVDVRAGAASVVIRFPAGVAGRIHMRSGLVGTNIDTARFPMSGNTYESPDYESAPNRAEIVVEAGAGSIEIVAE